MYEFLDGSMTYSCTFCNAKLWESEKLSTSTRILPKFPFSCGQAKVAKVVLSSLATPPDLLAHLLTAGDTRGRALRDNILAYNSALAFASLELTWISSLPMLRRSVHIPYPQDCTPLHWTAHAERGTGPGICSDIYP